jgi:hypothetical protein
MSCFGPTAVPEEPAEQQRGPCVAAGRRNPNSSFGYRHMPPGRGGSWELPKRIHLRASLGAVSLVCLGARAGGEPDCELSTRNIEHRPGPVLLGRQDPQPYEVHTCRHAAPACAFQNMHLSGGPSRAPAFVPAVPLHVTPSLPRCNGTRARSNNPFGDGGHALPRPCHAMPCYASHVGFFMSRAFRPSTTTTCRPLSPFTAISNETKRRHKASPIPSADP